MQAAAFALQSNRPAEAERIAAEVVRRSRSDARANQLYGYALLLQGKAKDAIAPLQRAFKQMRDTSIETQLAVALRDAGQTDEAMERFQHAVSRTPPFPPAFLEYGSFLNSLDRRDEAIDVLRRGFAIAPEFSPLALQLVQVLEYGGDLASAHEVLIQARAAAPKNCDVLYMSARAYQAKREFEQAAECFREVIKLNPKDAAAKIGLGICLLELGRDSEGLEQVSSASQTSEVMFGESVAALISAGRGRFWIRPSDARRALKGETK
ncbi:MAG: tetratricopeptide repeat protein [Pseudolabrys sp.]